MGARALLLALAAGSACQDDLFDCEDPERIFYLSADLSEDELGELDEPPSDDASAEDRRQWCEDACRYAHGVLGDPANFYDPSVEECDYTLDPGDTGVAASAEIRCSGHEVDLLGGCGEG